MSVHLTRASLQQVLLLQELIIGMWFENQLWIRDEYLSSSISYQCHYQCDCYVLLPLPFMNIGVLLAFYLPTVEEKHSICMNGTTESTQECNILPT